MKRSSKDLYPMVRSSGLLLLLLLTLSACSTYSPSRSYPARSYVYQPQVSSPYHSNFRYYGTYHPGWFVGSRYPGSYYGVGYGPMAYWPTYSYSNHYYSNYGNYYYPYYDYSRSFYYRPVYGYGYNPYSRQGNYGYRPYYGGSHSYRPPGQQERPSQDQPNPVAIPRERRSATVVTQPQGMTRSVSIAPTENGDQGMVVSSREDRKVKRSRLQPVAAQPDDGVITISSPGQQSSNRAPVPPVNPAIPVTRIANPRVYGTVRVDSVRTSPSDPSNEPPRPAVSSAPRSLEQAPARNTPVYQQPSPRSASPVRAEPMFQPQPSRNQPAMRSEPRYQPPPTRNELPPRSEPNYPVQLDSGNVTPRANRRQQRGVERGQQHD